MSSPILPKVLTDLLGAELPLLEDCPACSTEMSESEQNGIWSVRCYTCYTAPLIQAADRVVVRATWSAMVDFWIDNPPGPELKGNEYVYWSSLIPKFNNSAGG